MYIIERKGASLREDWPLAVLPFFDLRILKKVLLNSTEFVFLVVDDGQREQKSAV